MASAPRPGQAGGGPVGALRRLLMTGLTMGQTRLQLIGNEIQIGKHRALQQLARALFAVFCFCMALLLCVGLVLILLWDQRIAVLGVLIVAFLAAGAWLLQSLKKDRSAQEHPFAASLAELEEDLRQLKAAARHGQTQEPR